MLMFMLMIVMRSEKEIVVFRKLKQFDKKAASPPHMDGSVIFTSVRPM